VGGYDRNFLVDPEISVLPIVKSGGLAVFHVVPVPERGERCDIEAFGFLVIANR
jgi:hypothetical protein